MLRKILLRECRRDICYWCLVLERNWGRKGVEIIIILCLKYSNKSWGKDVYVEMVLKWWCIFLLWWILNGRLR